MFSNLSNARLIGTNLSGANLEGVDLSNSEFEFTIFDGANLKNAKIDLTSKNIRFCGAVLPNGSVSPLCE